MSAAYLKLTPITKRSSVLLSGWLCAAAFVFTILVSIVPSYAVCLIDSASFVYLHPYFEGKNWKVSAFDSLDISLDSSLCNLHPKSAAMVSTRTGAECITINAAGDVSRIHFDFSRSVCSCCRPVLSSQAPALLPIMAQSGVIYPLRKTGGIGDTLQVAVAGASSRIFIHNIRLSTSALIKTDTLILSAPPATPAVSGIWGTSISHAIGDSGIYVTGASGVIRYFGFNGVSWSSEQVFDIANTQNVTALGGSVAGTAAGRIYQRSGATYSLVTQPVASPIIRITDKAALSENGNIIIKSASTWNPFQTSRQSLRQFNLIKTRNGSAAELLDSSWRYSSFTYSDSTTSIFNVTPPAVKVFLDTAGSYEYGGAKAETVSVYFKDIDSNFSVPQVYFQSNPTILTGLQNTNPAAPCSTGIRYWADSMLTVYLKKDSVITQTRSQSGAFDFTCYSCYWTRQTFRTGKPWAQGMVLVIASPNDTLRINYKMQSTSALQRFDPQLMMSDIIIRAVNGQMHLILSPQLIKQAKAIRLFAADGRLTASMAPTSLTSIMATPSSGLVCVQIVMHNGSTLSRILPIVR
jgi:hypothetical protein